MRRPPPTSAARAKKPWIGQKPRYTAHRAPPPIAGSVLGGEAVLGARAPRLLSPPRRREPHRAILTPEGLPSEYQSQRAGGELLLNQKMSLGSQAAWCS